MNMSAQRAKMKGAYLFVSIRRGVEADVNDHLVANRDFTDLRTEQAGCEMQVQLVCWVFVMAAAGFGGVRASLS